MKQGLVLLSLHDLITPEALKFLMYSDNVYYQVSTLKMSSLSTKTVSLIKQFNAIELE